MLYIILGNFMGYNQSINVEKDNQELVEDLSGVHQLSKITNALWRQYRQTLNPSDKKNRYRDIRTSEDIDNYLKELRDLYPEKMTGFITEANRQSLLDELNSGAFVIDTMTGQHTSIIKKGD